MLGHIFVPFLPSSTDDGSLLLLLLCLPNTLLLLLLFSHPLLPHWQEIRPTLSTLPTVSQKSSTNFVESRSLEKTDSRPPPNVLPPPLHLLPIQLPTFRFRCFSENICERKGGRRRKSRRPEIKKAARCENNGSETGFHRRKKSRPAPQNNGLWWGKRNFSNFCRERKSCFVSTMWLLNPPPPPPLKMRNLSGNYELSLQAR